MVRRAKFAFLLAGVAAVANSVATDSRADSFTIINGQTANSTQILNTPGDVGTVQQGGTINSGAAAGIQASANGVTIYNAGSVTGLSRGIEAIGGNTITNSGTSTGGAFGIAVGSFNTITNSGTSTGSVTGINVASYNTITNSGTATGSTLNGIFGLDHNTITNSGTSTGQLFGIFGRSFNTITNSGTATGSTFVGINATDHNTISNSGAATGGSIGIAVGNFNTITNSGTATGSTIIGIIAADNNTITNSGTVRGSIYGISANSSNTIRNSGMITGVSAAVNFTGANNTLTLLAGSKIEGRILLDNPTNRLIIGPGLNTALAYTGGTIVDTGLPFIIDGGKLYAVDVTGFSVQDEMANDLTRAVSDAVDARLGAARAAGRGFSTAMNGTVVHAVADVPAGPGNSLWVSGLGSVRDQEGDSDTGSFNSLLGGFVVGGDALISTHTRAGLFAGASLADLDTEGDGQDLDNKSAFAGAYLSHDMGQSFVNAALIAGWSGFDSERHITNNQLPGGMETASADYDGFLLSPSLTLGHGMIMQGGILTPSVRVRYAGLFLEGYDESGSTANLSVDGRNINVLDARAELAYALNPHETESGVLSSTLRFGVDGTMTTGGDVSATLLAQSLNFDAAGSDTLRGFAGFDATYAMATGGSLKLSSEAGYDTRQAFTAQATASFAWDF